MSLKQQLYQDIILDHSKNPKNFKTLENPTQASSEVNALCGDKITVQINIQEGLLKEVAFSGTGCAIMTASASLMTEALQEKTTKEAEQLLDEFQKFITGNTENSETLPKKLTALKGLQAYPQRTKCGTLPWHTLHHAIKKYNEQQG